MAKKRFIALLVIAVFLFSIFAVSALAKSDNTMGKARDIAKNLIDKAKEKFNEAKQKFLDAVGKAKNAKKEFDKLKLKVKDCMSNETDECSEAKEKIKTEAKGFMSNSIDKVLNFLNKLKSKVESSDALTDEQAKEIIAEIDAKIAEVESAKQTIETSTDKAEIKLAAKTIKEIWSDAHSVMKKSIARLTSAKIGGILVKIEHLKTKLANILKKMSAKGIDVTNLNASLEAFDSHIKSAGDSYTLAVQKYADAAEKTGQESSDLMKEATDYLRTAHSELKEANKVLKDIVAGIKSKEPDALETSDETEDNETGDQDNDLNETEGQEGNDTGEQENETANDLNETEED